MVPAIYSTTAAAPLLFLGLQKIARTPRPRLQVGYQILPSCERAACDRTYVQANSAPRTEVRGIRPLGNAMYLDRLLAGGVVGEALPLTNLRITYEQRCPLGAAIDVTV